MQRIRQGRTTGGRAARRTAAVLAALALILSQAVLHLGRTPQRADAVGLDSMTVLSVTSINDFYPPSEIGNYQTLNCFEVNTGYDGIAFCGAKSYPTPKAGDVYSNGSSIGNAALDYVMYHGWGGPGDSRPSGLTDGRWRLATAYAVWAVMPNAADNPHDVVYQEMANANEDTERAFLDLVDKAKKYAESGDKSLAGCAIFWPSPNGTSQPLVTRVEPSGSIELVKSSSNAEMSGASPSYALEGAVYGVYSDKACEQLVASMTTDSEGRAAASGLPQGTYYVRETSPSAGYALDETVYEVSVSAGVEARLDVEETPQSNPLDVVIAKLDAETDEAQGQGDASLEGAEFTVDYYAGTYETAEGLPSSPTRSWVLRTDAYGEARLDESHLVSGDPFYLDSSGSPALPLGTVAIRETSAPEGYKISDGPANVQVISSEGTTESVNAFVTPTYEESVIRGGISLQKMDRELADSGADDPAVALGSASLEGARFEVVNSSAMPVVVDGELHVPGEVVATLETNVDGTASTAADLLPYGTYTVTEAEPPEGYLLNEDWSAVVEVREDGRVYELATTEDAPLDQVIRGDLSFTKAEEGSQSRMAGVAFLITSQTTGERHVVVSDENGMVNTSSDWHDRGEAVNASDAALREDGSIDDALLTADSGVWFSGSAEAATTPTNELGALPYDTYLVNELPCAANEGHRLVSTLVTVSRDSVNLDIGTMDDETVPVPTIRTELLSDVTHDHDAPSHEASTVTDVASLDGLEPGRTYTVTGRLRVVESGEDGSPVPRDVIAEAEKTFVAESEAEKVSLTFEIDGTSLAGRTLNASETLSCDGVVIASHDDVTDEAQSVRLPAVFTSATSETGDGALEARENQTLTDLVHVDGLIVGKTYELTATVHAKETGEDGSVVDLGELTDEDGNPVSATKTFTATATSMDVEVSVVLDASELAGKQVVCFERLSRGGVTLALHADIEDEGQTLDVTEPPEPESPQEPPTPSEAQRLPETGESASLVATIGFGGATLAAIGACLVSRRRRPRR